MKNTLSKLVAQKIPALRGRDAETNGMILELLALEGAQTVWNINKMLGRSRERYPTIYRAINRLKKRAYVTKTGTVKMVKKKGRTATYGLTFRGFIASLAGEKVVRNVLSALEKNTQLFPLSIFPFPREVMLAIAKDLFGDEQIEELTRSLFEGFLKAIPNDIESVDEAKYFAYLIPTLVEAPPSTLKEKKQEDITNVLLRYPQVVNWSEETLENLTEGLRGTLEKVEEFRKYLQTLRRHSNADAKD